MICTLRSSGECDRCDEAPLIAVSKGNFTTMLIGDGLNNTQPESGTTRFSISGLFNAIERKKHLFQFLFGDTGPVVSHTNLHTLFSLQHINGRCVSKLYSVFDHICHGALQCDWFTPKYQRVG